MNEPYVSVVIPTYNRATKLKKCLDALLRQTLASGSFELIVVDDGSTDETQSMLDSYKNEYPNVRVFKQKNGGQGKARNLGLENAKGQIVVFIGDDIYASPKFLELHVRFHQNNPGIESAALGLTEWDPAEPINRFMKWLTSGGPQFAFHHLEANCQASFWYFYTSNVSVKKDMIARQTFDTDFKSYGYEDIEFAYRLSLKGLRIIFIPDALAFHDHFLDENSLKDRMLSIGRNAKIFKAKHPEVDCVPQGLKLFALQVVTMPPFILCLKFLKICMPTLFSAPYWTILSKRYFLDGLSRV